MSGPGGDCRFVQIWISVGYGIGQHAWAGVLAIVWNIMYLVTAIEDYVIQKIRHMFL